MLTKAVNRLQGAFRLPRCKARPLLRPTWPASTAQPTHPPHPSETTRLASSSARWKTRQSKDAYTRQSKVSGLKSRAAFKLLEINAKHRLFRPGDTVVDLGYAPGSWSQVAITQVQPGGRVVGIDVIPSQPPKGVSTIQGDFLSAEVREEVRGFVSDVDRGRVRDGTGLGGGGMTVEELDEVGKGTVQREQEMGGDQKALDRTEGRTVDVVLSDMSEPWPLVASTWIKSVSNPYHRMMNTSGMALRDHAGSMDLCNAALIFCYDTLVTGGHFVCKFYQGGEDQALERRLRTLFEKVHRIKPDSSRKESRESFFVCLRRKAGVHRDAVFDDEG